MGFFRVFLQLRHVCSHGILLDDIWVAGLLIRPDLLTGAFDVRAKSIGVMRAWIPGVALVCNAGGDELLAGSRKEEARER
jgi:hypothetical protein